MRQFNGGKTIARILQRTKNIKYSAHSVTLLNRYVFTCLFACLGIWYLYHFDKIAIDPSNFSNNIALLTLLFSGVLLIQLSKVKSLKKGIEKKLLASEYRLGKIYNAGIVGLIFSTLDGKVMQANDCFLAIIGYTREDLEAGAISWKTLTPDEYDNTTNRALQQLKANGFCEPFEKEYFRKDGSRIHVMLASAMLCDDDAADAITYVVDISHRHQAEKREEKLNQIILKQKEELYRLLMNAPAMISIRRGADLSLEFLNKASVKYAGEKHLGLNVNETAQKFNLESGTEIVKNVYKTGEPFTAKAYHFRFDRAQNGVMEDAWFDFTAEPLLNEQGKVDGVASFAFDVTEMVKANMDIKESESRFRFLADCLPHKIWTSGPDGKANYYNKGWYDYLGVQTLPELRNAIWASLHPDDLKTAEQIWGDTIASGKDLETEQRFKNANGIYEWHLTRCKAQRNEHGEITLWIGSCTNIQHQKALQETADLLSEKKDEFLGIASHELKTPITIMKASLQILNNLAETDFDVTKVKNFVGMAHKQITKLNIIVDDLLDVTKLESGKMSLNYGEFSIKSAIQDCLDEVSVYLTNQQVELKPMPDVIINADRVRIEQVIINLLTNAIKYSPLDSVITITTEQNAERVKFSVTDNGIGIKQSRQSLIFEKFSRAHESSQKYAGLGLGLYISSQIIAQHGGQIGVISESGKGIYLLVHIAALSFFKNFINRLAN